MRCFASSMMWLRPAVLADGLWIPDVGSTLKLNANNASSRMPRKKSGVAYVNIEMPVAKRSNQLLRCHADLMPSSRPITVDSTVESPTSQMVGQIAFEISYVTGGPDLYDVPRFPRSVCLRYSQN